MPSELIPDYRTVLMMQAVVGLLFSVIFAATWRRGEGGANVGVLATAHFLIGFGLSLWVLRDAVSPMVSITVANTLIHVGSATLTVGVWREAGYRFPVRVLPPLLIAHTALFYYYTHYEPHFQIRVVAAAGLQAVCFLLGGAALWFDRHRWRRPISRFAAGFMLLIGSGHLLRTATTALYGSATVNPNAAGGQAGLMILFAVAAIVVSAGLLWIQTATWRHEMALEVESRRRSEAELARARDAAEQAAQAKSRFIAHMSHEIRTPMNAVIGLTRMLGQTRLDERQRLCVARIGGAADTLMQLIDGVFNVARMEADRVRLENADFSPAETIGRVAAIASTIAEARGLDFRIETPADLPGALHGDAARLGQVLVNLLGNAVKFTETGSVVLSTLVVPAAGEKTAAEKTAGEKTGNEARSNGAVRLRFTVRDTGPGLPADQIPLIFEPFHQTGDGARLGGAGLGLAISRQLVELMGGSITVDSVVGRGSAFVVDVPFAPAEASESALRPVAANEIRLDGVRVLVADDDEINRVVAREILERAGAVVETAFDGREAAARALTPGAAPDAVLMDVRMPDLDGVAAAAWIRETRSRGDLPIIAVTAHAMDEERERCLAAGMNDFVVKPVSPDLLLAAVARWTTPRAALAAPPAAPVPPALPDDVPGLDLAGTLERFCGNAAVVRNLLGGFARRCDAAAGALAGLAHGDDCDVDAASALVHGLRGAAATLGADEAARRAARLETTLRDGDRRDPDAVRTEAASLLQALAAATAALRAAGLAAPVATGPNPSSPGPTAPGPTSPGPTSPGPAAEAA